MTPGDKMDSSVPSEGFGMIAALLFILVIAAVATPLAIVSRTQVQVSSYSGKQTRFNFLSVGLSRLVYALLSKLSGCF